LEKWSWKNPVLTLPGVPFTVDRGKHTLTQHGSIVDTTRTDRSFPGLPSQSTNLKFPAICSTHLAFSLKLSINTAGIVPSQGYSLPSVARLRVS